MSPRTVVVVGAGPAGLAAAIALTQRGHAVEVVEQRARDRFISDAGGAYELTATTLEYLEALGALDEVRARGTGLSRFALRAMSGRLLQRLDFAKARFEVFAITRAALQAALLGRLEALGGQIHFERRITGVEQTDGHVQLSFGDGPAVPADVVIGADGVHSAVRRVAFDGEPARDVGIAALWGRAELGSLDLARGESLGFVGAGTSIVVACAGAAEDPRLLFTICARTSSSPLDREALFQAMPRELAPMLASVRDVAETRLHAQPPLRHYARGHVVLIGDAAHGMPPFLGLGANSAIEDAVLVARAIDSDPLALETFGRKRAALLEPRIAESRRLGSAMHARSRVADSLFRAVTWMVPSALVLRQMRSMHVRVTKSEAPRMSRAPRRR